MDVELASGLERGGLLITANTRQARQARREYDQRQHGLGLGAWRSPAILPWGAWMEALWREAAVRVGADPVLAEAQEQALWEQIVESSPESAEILDLSAAAREARAAWGLVRSHLLPLRGRLFDAHAEASAFRGWAHRYQTECELLRRTGLARWPDQVSAHFREGGLRTPPSVFLAGFDDVTPQQRKVLEGVESRGGRVTVLADRIEPRGETRCWRASDPEAEVEEAATWAAERLGRHEAARIGVVIPDLAVRRKMVSRIFRSRLGSGAFHVSWGPPLAARPMAAAAIELLNMCREWIPFSTVSRLVHSPYAGRGAEAAPRARFDFQLRKMGCAEWRLEGLLDVPDCPPHLGALLRRWIEIRKGHAFKQNPSAWSVAFAGLLRAFEWPGTAAASTETHQTLEAWGEALAQLGSLDGILSEITAGRATGLLAAIAQDKTFEPENLDQPVQVMGLAEAIGGRFDHLWIAGMHDGAWPPRPSPPPLLPPQLVRERNIPHATAAWQLAWAKRMTQRLLASAEEVVVSWPAVEGDTERGPSPLFSGLEKASGHRKASATAPLPMEELEDSAAPPLSRGSVHSGGTRAIEHQAACPFRAFAQLRLGAGAIESPETGLTPRDRGSLMHRAMEAVWRDLRTSAVLARLAGDEQRERVRAAVDAAVGKWRRPITPVEARLRELEKDRLTNLVCRWLEVERKRQVAFEAVEREGARRIEAGELMFDIRIDRIDRLEGGGEVLIDYKSSAQTLVSWDGARPEEPQLPVYAVTSADTPAGVAFAVLDTAGLRFQGIAAGPGILPQSQVVAPDELMRKREEWREAIEALASGFRSGEAAVDPKNAGTCAYCHLGVLCRIDERRREAEG